MSSVVIIISIVAIALIIGCVFVINANSKRSESEPRKSIDPPPIAPAPAPAPYVRPIPPPSVSKNHATISIYDDCDCTSNEIDNVRISKGNILPFSGFISIDKDQQWKCIKHDNMVIRDVELAYSGKKNGSPVSHSEKGTTTIRDSPVYTVGCDPGDTEFRTDGLKFNWSVLE